MPQEFQALQCYSCKIFQVEIVKKKPTWECKLCHEKQSLKQVFLRGSSKDCRLFIQNCNKNKIELEKEILVQSITVEKPVFCDEIELLDDVSESFAEDSSHKSKWQDFVPLDHICDDDNDGEESCYTFMKLDKKKRKANARDKKSPKKQKVNDMSINTSFEFVSSKVQCVIQERLENAEYDVDGDQFNKTQKICDEVASSKWLQFVPDESNSAKGDELTNINRCKIKQEPDCINEIILHKQDKKDGSVLFHCDQNMVEPENKHYIQLTESTCDENKKVYSKHKTLNLVFEKFETNSELASRNKVSFNGKQGSRNIFEDADNDCLDSLCDF